MSKKITGLLAVALSVTFATTAYCASEELLEGMAQKFWVGLVDTFTGWVELPAQVIKGYNEGFMDDENNKILGVVVGVFDGLGHSAGRTFSGLTNLFGFWAASPEDNRGIGLPLDAEYAWEEGEAYDVFDPDLVEGGLKPVGRKLMKGLSNTLLGFVELPGQIVKGVEEGAPDLGIVKGFWYWWSREVNGFSGIMTCVLPDHSETKGLAFDEEYPWEALVERMQ